MTEKSVQFPPMISGTASLTSTEKMLLGSFLALVRPRLVVELGVYQALTTEFICHFMELNSIEGRVVGFDLPEVVENLRNVNANVQRHEQTGRLQLIGGRLPSSLRTFLDTVEVVDLALVDAIHDYPNVLGELELLWGHLSPDAVILCHDYCEKFDGVQYAVDHFAKRHQAMVLNLDSSTRARDTGSKSVLAALRKRPYQVTVQKTLFHRWHKVKFDLIRNPTFSAVWMRFLRPLVKRRN